MILVIIDISSITIRFACFIVSNFVLNFMILVKYPLTRIFNIKCTVSAYDDNHNAATPIELKTTFFCLVVEVDKLANISQKMFF
jgi:hypothetical protein